MELSKNMKNGKKPGPSLRLLRTLKVKKFSRVLLNNQKMAPYLDIFKYTLLVTNYVPTFKKSSSCFIYDQICLLDNFLPK